MNIAFICVANSARSQMAEAMARAMAPLGVSIFSAGSRPTRVHPLAIEAMTEVGLDISSYQSKGFDAIPKNMDVVIRLCAEENCPTALAQCEQYHWPIDDPAAVSANDSPHFQKQKFNLAREQLREKLQHYFRRMDDSPMPE